MFYFYSEGVTHLFFWFDKQYWYYSIDLRNLDASHFARRFLERLKNPINNSYYYFFQYLECFISLARLLHMFFFGLIHSIGVTQYIWETWMPDNLRIVFYKVPNIAVFHISLFLRCLYFHILVASKRDS